jgi:lipopolysaccharide/colanic/teichoic acid biosynthesis glycosyltransferase
VPHMPELLGSAGEFEDLDDMKVLGVRSIGLSNSSALIKRALDLVVSVIGVVLLSPLLIASAIAVRLDSKGPILFRQERVGRHNKVFWMYKFRTMRDGADAERAELMHLNETDGLFKIANDPRLTRVGRFMRSISLDELPQLFNVIRGEMSLVGPRPLVIEEDRKVSGWARRRLDLTPGMTGVWQIRGSTRVPLSEMVKLDYLYVANWSLWGDLKALLRTLPHVLGRRGL